MPRKAKNKIADDVGDFSIVLTDYVERVELGEDDVVPAHKTYTYEIQVFDADRNVMELIRGNMEDELPPGQIQNYITSMDFFRNKALEDIINTP